ncbi:hypothetical protein D3C76_581460 [compost metagenome]
MPQLGNHDQIFPPGQNLVHGGKLPGQTERLPHMVGLCRNVEAVYGGSSAILIEQRGEDSDNRCLTRAVGAKQGENLTSLHFKIDAL